MAETTGTTNRTSVSAMKWLLTPNYEGLEGGVRFFCQICVAGFLAISAQAADGETCGRGWNFWVPQTWGNPIFCFVRELGQQVPPSFTDGVLPAAPQPESAIVGPPASDESQPDVEPAE